MNNCHWIWKMLGPFWRKNCVWCIMPPPSLRITSRNLHYLNNSTIHFVCNFIPWQAPVTPYRLSLGQLIIENRRMLLISALEFTVLSSHQPVYLLELLTLRTDVALRWLSRRQVAEPLTYRTLRPVTQEKSFHIMASIFVNSLAHHQIPFDLLILQRFKTLVKSRLSFSEAPDWHSRVMRDANLVLNPLPHDDALRAALKNVVKSLTKDYIWLWTSLGWML